MRGKVHTEIEYRCTMKILIMFNPSLLRAALNVQLRLAIAKYNFSLI